MACQVADRVIGPEANLVMPARQGGVDTSRLIKKFRDRGAGTVFIGLTTEPSSAALAELAKVGVLPPPGRPGVVTFDSLKIATVWAYLAAPAVKVVAQLPYVVRIESSEDIRTILPHGSSLPINSTASEIKWNLLRVRAPDLWRDFEVTGQRQLAPNGWQSSGVAVLDDGGDYRLTYPATNWQFSFSYSYYNFTTDPTPRYLGQHGTDVGSLVAGEPDNLWGAGVAPRAAVEFIKVLPSGDDWGPIVQGLNYAYGNGNAVVNMSFGNCGDLPPSTVQTAISRFPTRVPADAANPGVGLSLVASAGEGTLTSPTPCPTTAVSYPAAYAEVIAVAAIDSNNHTLNGLSVGPKVELSAPGICVSGLLVGGGDHTCLSGTSFAAAHVAGLIAAIRAKNNTLSANDVRALLDSTATKMSGQTLPRDDRFGYGLINAYAMLSAVPAVPPDSVPAAVWAQLHSAGNMVGSAPQWSAPFPRNLILLMFREDASQADKQAAVDSVRGRVVGGARIETGGYYYVTITDDGTPGPLFAAILKLQSLPQVDLATPELPDDQSLYLKPQDGDQWRDWHIDRDSAAGQKWGLEAVAAPLAWGCSTGDSTLLIGVPDHAFHGATDLTDNVDPTSPALFGEYPTEDHGIGVASIIAARGNNGKGMAGMMWRAKMVLAESELPQPGHAVIFLQNIHRLAARGARVINGSRGFAWVDGPLHRLPLPNAGDSAIANAVRAALRREVQLLHNLGYHPLLVLGAGNDGEDAYWGGYPGVADDFPQDVVVVASSDSGGVLSFGSDTGHLVSVAAPGGQVGGLTIDGTINRYSGTSFAAPFVTGLAGLLFSFDSRLTTAEVRDRIVGGAVAGQRFAGHIPIINAYASLKLAAQRPGAPLCGSRVWASGTGVYAQRDTNSTTGELLFDLGDRASWVNVFHGGHRIEVFDPGFFTHAFRYVSPGNWQPTTDTAVTLPGGTFSSLLWYSHDQDSVADITTVRRDGSVTFDVGVRVGTSPRQRLDTFRMTLATADTTCTYRTPDPPTCWNSVAAGTVETINWAAAFGLTGGQILVSVSKVANSLTSISGWSLCPTDPNFGEECRSASFLATTESTYVWSVPTSGGQPHLLWKFPKYAYWLAGSEDGQQIVTGEGQYQETSRLSLGQQLSTDPPTYSGCGVGYRRASTGAAAITLIATQAVCLESQGQGTLAPAPRRARSR